MSERTLWMGIKAEAAQKAAGHKIRLASLVASLRMALVAVEPSEINAESVLSLATDIHGAKIDYDSEHATYLKACAELGEKA